MLALEIAITGYLPGVNDPDRVLSVMVASLVIVLLDFPLTFISGFAYYVVKSDDTAHERSAVS